MTSSPSTVSVKSDFNGTHQYYIHYSVTQGRKSLHAPDGHVIMIAVDDFPCLCTHGVNVYDKDQHNSQIRLWAECGRGYSKAFVLWSDVVSLQWNMFPRCKENQGLVTVHFSFHPRSEIPQKLSSGLYNCTVGYYWRFKEHLDCNLNVECEDGQDEAGHCPFSNRACQGWVASGNKCYIYRKGTLGGSAQSYSDADKYCRSLNASLATFRDSKDGYVVLDKISRVVTYFENSIIGVRYGVLSVPNVYRRSLLGNDKTVIHHSFQANIFYQGDELCFTIYVDKHRTSHSTLYGHECSRIHEDESIICEVTVSDSDQNHNKTIRTLQVFTTRFRNENASFTRCPNGEVMHMFLACYPHNACGQRLPHSCTFSSYVKSLVNVQGMGQLMTSAAVFSCGSDVIRLSYALVCDFRYHCKDGSDETFCQHPPCDAFGCSNGQCVSFSKLCDLVSDCLDHSDEMMCLYHTPLRPEIKETRSPVLISFDGANSFTAKEMSANETCPETHYSCPGEFNDCLPVYTRCNGWYDCVQHEDEQDCENMTCFGFYRCFNSTVCVHAENLCDGWPHCPQHDDEWLCNLTCPTQCLCRGQDFLCSNRISAQLFPHLRYLDARGSGMTPSDFNNNSYIMHLDLSNCSLSFLPIMAFLNLLFLDLSTNNLAVFNISVLAHLGNLKTLSLANNPIDIINYEPNSLVQLNLLHTVDLSHSQITVIDSKALSNIVYVQTLNLSFPTIHTIHPDGFQYTPKLTHLYLAGNPINTVSVGLFKPLTVLRTLSSQTYKLCCREVLPDHFELVTCDAPRNKISSCKDLLRSGMYRSFLWLISILSLLGNVFCLVARACVQRSSSVSGFHVFVTNLSVADLLMGVYIVIIGVADLLFLGKYFFYDETWKHSVACKVAGFLSLLSSEVSAFTIWLITLDRFLVLRFPFSSVRFRAVSAAAACLVTWLVGVLIALVPLLPVTSHWEFYSRTGICIPLPVTRQDFQGKAFSFGVFIAFNFILFVLIAMGQAFIYWSVQKNALNTDSTKVSRDLTIARRLISVAVTDFLCWFPIGLCGLLALADIPIAGEVNVAFAIFVLPLNSALNPFMYTFNILMEKRRKSKEAVLLHWLESHSDFAI